MSNTIKPYTLLARELKSLLNSSQTNRNIVTEHAKIVASTFKAACAGNRALPEKSLTPLVELCITDQKDAETYIQLLKKINKPNASLVHLLRGAKARLRLGYLDSPPFASFGKKGENHPQGLLIELIELFLQLVGASWQWERVDFQNLTTHLETGSVDMITGFVLETPKRKTRTTFIPLQMPFSVGINGLTRSNLFNDDLTYLHVIDLLEESAKKGENKVNIITIEDEIADDYFPALFPESIVPRIKDSNKTVDQAIDSYLNHHEEKDINIVFADSITCERNLKLGINAIFKDPVGDFFGGFLLPIQDPEWAQYFNDSFQSFMHSRLPQLGQIFLKYAHDLSPFLRSQQGQGKKAWAIDEWLKLHWPESIPIPQGFKSNSAKPQGSTLIIPQQ